VPPAGVEVSEIEYTGLFVYLIAGIAEQTPHGVPIGRDCCGLAAPIESHRPPLSAPCHVPEHVLVTAAGQEDVFQRL
jgi:hypothetical protein